MEPIVLLKIYTDGLPSDTKGRSTRSIQQQESVDTLRLLGGLPVWLVVRLFMDDEVATGVECESPKRLGWRSQRGPQPQQVAKLR
jgi:hypothetical protein